MSDIRIPFNKPFIIGHELDYIRESVESGQISGDGLFTRKCHELMQSRFGALKVLLTTSCTAALEMSAMLCDIGPGDEVILPSFTFVSTANAFHLRGASLKFVDVQADTLNLDPNKLPEAITSRTKAIVPVHYAGVSCDMDAIMDIATSKQIYVIEDAAQGVNSKHSSKYLGTIGDLGAYSFHETKNFISGEGGALVVNNPAMIERAEIIREKGTNRSKFFRGEVDKYTWVDIGSSYLPSDLLAAFLYAQLEHMDEITEKRLALCDYYHQKLSPLEAEGRMSLPTVPEYASSNGHMFYLLLGTEAERDDLIGFLKQHGVLAVFHYLPLHLSDIGRSMGYRDGSLPVTESASRRLLRLPLYYELTHDQQDEIVVLIQKFLSR